MFLGLDFFVLSFPLFVFLASRKFLDVMISFVLLICASYSVYYPIEDILSLLVSRGAGYENLDAGLFLYKCYIVLFSLIYLLFMGNFAFSSKFIMPCYPLSSLKYSFALKIFQIIVVFCLLEFFGRRGWTGTLIEFFALMGLLLYSGKRSYLNSLMLCSLSLIAVGMWVSHGVRMLVVIELLGLFIYFFQGRIISKLWIVIFFILGFVLLFLLGIYRWGWSAVVVFYEFGFDDILVSRVLANNFAGSVASSVLMFDVFSMVSWESLLAGVRLLIPFPSVFLGDLFDISSDVSIPGGGATPLYLLGGLGLGFVTLLVWLSFYRFAFVKTMGNFGEILVCVMSLKIILYSPIPLVTIILYAFVTSTLIMRLKHV